MNKIDYRADSMEELKLSDETVEVIMLPATLKRLEIAHAPNLKKIISYSPELTIGPSEKKLAIPALNHCKSLCEIITMGDVRFNTMLNIGGRERACAWTTVGRDNVYEHTAPVLTTIGYEAIYDFPCYYYDLNAPVDEPRLEYYYPEVRVCPSILSEQLLESALEDVNVPTQFNKDKQLELVGSI